MEKCSSCARFDKLYHRFINTDGCKTDPVNCQKMYPEFSKDNEGKFCPVWEPATEKQYKEEKPEHLNFTRPDLVEEQRRKVPRADNNSGFIKILLGRRY